MRTQQRAHPRQERGYHAADIHYEQEDEWYELFEGEHGYLAADDSDDSESCEATSERGNEEEESALHIATITREFASAETQSIEYNNMMGKMALPARESSSATITRASNSESDTDDIADADAFAGEYGLVGTHKTCSPSAELTRLGSVIVDPQHPATACDDDMLVDTPPRSPKPAVHMNQERTTLPLKFVKRASSIWEKVPTSASEDNFIQECANHAAYIEMHSAELT
jgi:hypothetical protein